VGHPPPATRERRMTILVERGGGGGSGGVAGTHRGVEVSCGIGVARRLCTHSEVPDRRGVARRASGGSGSERGATPATLSRHGTSTPNDSSGAVRALNRKRRCAEPEFAAGDLHAASHVGAMAGGAIATGTLG
jgi:hypothetical protein